MRLISTILRIIANIFLYCVYILIAITIVNFSYGLIIVNAWKNVPGSDDPIHMALAIGATWIITLITFILRKYFYISLWIIENINNSEKYFFKNIVKNIKKVKKESKKNVKKVIKKEENIFDDEMKIYIDKEIK